MTRLLIGIAVAPLAAIPILSILFGPWAAAHGGLRSLLGIVGPTVVAIYPLLVLFGLPLHLALARQGYTNLRHYVTAGALLGAVPVIGYVVVAVVFEAKFAVSAMGRATVRNLEWGGIGVVVFGAVSAAVAAVFWQMAVRNTARD